MSDLSMYATNPDGSVRLKKDGTPALKRGRGAASYSGSSKAPKFVTSKTKHNTESKRSKKYTNTVSTAAEKPKGDPAFMESMVWWKDRYRELEKATRELMAILDDGAERDNIEATYRLTFKTHHAHRDRRFSRDNDPVNKIYRLLHNEDIFEAKMKAV